MRHSANRLGTYVPMHPAEGERKMDQACDAEWVSPLLDVTAVDANAISPGGYAWIFDHRSPARGIRLILPVLNKT